MANPRLQRSLALTFYEILKYHVSMYGCMKLYECIHQGTLTVPHRWVSTSLICSIPQGIHPLNSLPCLPSLGLSRVSKIGIEFLWICIKKRMETMETSNRLSIDSWIDFKTPSKWHRKSSEMLQCPCFQRGCK